MKVISVKAILAMSILALLMAGCTYRGRQAPIRQTLGVNPASQQLTELKQENTSLRQKQLQNEAKIAELEKMLGNTRNEQARFQRTMRSNFDMMEQSVSLSLAKRAVAKDGSAADQTRPEVMGREPKTIVREPKSVLREPKTRPPERKVSARQDQAPEQRTASRVSATTVAPNARVAGTSLKITAADRAQQVKPTAPAQRTPRSRMRETPPRLSQAAAERPQRATLVALAAPRRSGEREEAQEMETDSDLVAPASPRRLSAHGPAKRLYEKGFALFAGKDYPQSILVFRNFLNRFPNDSYSDNAQFWIGEAYRLMDQPEKADLAYRMVLRNFEHKSTLEGYKTPDAMYRLGKSFHRQRRLAQARQFFQALATRFPETSAGRKAKRELSTLQTETTARN